MVVHARSRSFHAPISLIVFGSSVRNSISRGYLYGAVRAFAVPLQFDLQPSLGAQSLRNTTKL